MDFASTISHEIVKDVSREPVIDIDEAKKICENVKEISNTIIKVIPRDEENCIIRKHFFIGNYYFTIKLY